MKIKLYGTRGSIATPGEEFVKYGGDTTCISVISDSDRKLIFDAGTGIRRLSLDYSENGRPLPIDACLFMTHVHQGHRLLGFSGSFYFSCPCQLEFQGLTKVIDTDGASRSRMRLSAQALDTRCAPTIPHTRGNA